MHCAKLCKTRLCAPLPRSFAYIGQGFSRRSAGQLRVQAKHSVLVREVQQPNKHKGQDPDAGLPAGEGTLTHRDNMQCQVASASPDRLQ